ncbi:hypothetical protein ACROYT_G012455 [Oculina patagonica]
MPRIPPKVLPKNPSEILEQIDPETFNRNILIKWLLRFICYWWTHCNIIDRGIEMLLKFFHAFCAVLSDFPCFKTERAEGRKELKIVIQAHLGYQRDFLLQQGNCVIFWDMVAEEAAQNAKENTFQNGAKFNWRLNQLDPPTSVRKDSQPKRKITKALEWSKVLLAFEPARSAHKPKDGLTAQEENN